LLPKATESPIANKYKIKTIPRYMIMDKNGKEINDDAPRPSDNHIKKVLDNLLGRS
tara:strand:+ start:106 stop:273 length:168 start_codon:yes stop_codon:yes gene_type:complete